LYNFLLSFNIYGCNLKIINASQGYIHKYENLKRKLFNCNANIYFNQQRRVSPENLFSSFRVTVTDTPLGANLSFWQQIYLLIIEILEFVGLRNEKGRKLRIGKYPTSTQRAALACQAWWKSDFNKTLVICSRYISSGFVLINSAMRIKPASYLINRYNKFGTHLSHLIEGRFMYNIWVLLGLQRSTPKRQRISRVPGFWISYVGI